jgi:glycerophosphoryl diester phosphodiesterase
LIAAARELPSVHRGLLALPGWLGVWARSFGFILGNAQCLHVNFRDLDKQQVLRVHRLRRLINVWTVNTREDILNLMDWDVDGFFTDNPGMVARLLGGMN